MLKLLRLFNRNDYVLYTITNNINNRKFLWKDTSLNNAVKAHKANFAIQQYYLNDLLTYDMFVYGFENFSFDIYKTINNIDSHKLDLILTKELMSEQYVYNNLSPVFYNDFSFIRRTNEFYFYEGLNNLKIWNEVKLSENYLQQKKINEKWFDLAKEYNLLRDSLSNSVINSVNAVLEVENLYDFSMKEKKGD
ncbi:hypothetical protein [Mycoplasma sp. P36-A1]|uniref:hypothetical protein n=1 Tax=Mycoplasma sp. P36-A1 TaxID=3252900 RepID=UPI003C2B1C2A